MLRQLLVDRFQLQSRREEREMLMYALTVERTGPKLTSSKPDVAPTLINRVFPITSSWKHATRAWATSSP